MELVADDRKRGLKTPVWDEYKAIINEAEGREVSLPTTPVTHATPAPTGTNRAD